jgi:hypothetical protein
LIPASELGAPILYVQVVVLEGCFSLFNLYLFAELLIQQDFHVQLILSLFAVVFASPRSREYYGGGFGGYGGGYGGYGGYGGGYGGYGGYNNGYGGYGGYNNGYGSGEYGDYGGYNNGYNNGYGGGYNNYG